MDDLNGTDDRRLNSCSSAADTQNSSASVLPTNSFPADDFPARRSLVLFGSCSYSTGFNRFDARKNAHFSNRSYRGESSST